MMPRFGWRAPAVASVSALVGLATLGVAWAQQAAPPTVGRPVAKQEQSKQAAKLTTPSTRVDPKTLIDVVNAEVKGGEATSGPSPINFLWQPSDESLIADEAVEIKAPVGFPPIVGPASNPITRGKIELGKQLYFDPRVSLDGTVSCATCHNPEKGWTDNLAKAVGIKGQVGGRNSPTVLNTTYGRTMFWDGRAPSLEAQAQGPVQNKIEMGDQSYAQIVDRLRKIPDYHEQFKKVFGTEVTLDGMAKAIATFERTAISAQSPYDRYTRGEAGALTESQKRGMILFGLRLDQDDEYNPDVTLQKARCTLCHVGFNFTDELFHNLGVGWDAQTGRFADLGRWAVAPIGAKAPSEIGSFKTPTLRDITKTGPYMHDGSEATLEAVIDYYDRGGNANPHLDKDMRALKLTAQEKNDLVEFMKALTGAPVEIALPTLPPGPDGSRPDPRKALTPPTKTASTLVNPHGVLVNR